MSDHDTVRSQPLSSFVAPMRGGETGLMARRAESEDGSGATCRLGDASCASAHAASVSRSALGSGAMLHRSLHRLQRDYGNRFVGHVLRQATGGSGSTDKAMESVEHSIDSARGGGQGLDHTTQRRMESSFGADFSGVRIHHDARADGLNQALSARAFTTGRDVFFRQGEYSPGTSAGRELLAHELTHVVQQNGAGIQRKMTISDPGDAHEVEADQMARQVMLNEHAVQRQPEAPESAEEDREEEHTGKAHRRIDSRAVSRRQDDDRSR